MVCVKGVGGAGAHEQAAAGAHAGRSGCRPGMGSCKGRAGGVDEGTLSSMVEHCLPWLQEHCLPGRRSSFNMVWGTLSLIVEGALS